MSLGILPLVFWGTEEVEVFSDEGRSLASIPKAFLTGSGNNTWAYVVDVVERITGVMFTSAPALRDDRTGEFVNQEDEPRAGTYTLVSTGALNPTPQLLALRPESVRPPATAASSSSTGTGNSSQFRSQLLTRAKGQCLVTGRTRGIEAAHLAPKILGQRRLHAIVGRKVASVYDPSLGVLLDQHLHSEYNNRHFAFYPSIVDGNEERWRCHYFIPPIPPDEGETVIASTIDNAYRACHGTVVTVTGRITTRPSWRLASWHYTQCVRSRFVGIDRDPVAEDGRRP